MYLAAGCESTAKPRPPVKLDQISGDTFLLLHERCGLTIRIRQLFRARRLKVRPYEAQAVSYSVLEEWAQLGFGSAILPTSKLASPELGQQIVLGNGQPAVLHFEAAWSAANVVAPHLQAFAHQLKRASAAVAS